MAVTDRMRLRLTKAEVKWGGEGLTQEEGRPTSGRDESRCLRVTSKLFRKHVTLDLKRTVASVGTVQKAQKGGCHGEWEGM